MFQEQQTQMEKIVALAKHRGFIFPGSEIYGGLAGTWDYGPLGVELKNNIKQLWWKRFVQARDDVVGIDTAIIMNPRVWEQSGHVETFTDPLIECRKCHQRFKDTDYFNEDDRFIWRSDFESAEERKVKFKEARLQILKERMQKKGCLNCKSKELTLPRNFNLLFRTFVGPVEDSTNQTYLRPETAQGMFVNFKNILDTTHRKLPFGIAQIGKAFRNEITPRDFLFRSREFEQMEIEYFVRGKDWKDYFEHWLGQMREWIDVVGIRALHLHELEVSKGDLAHYSKRTVDFEYDFPFGRKELYGIAYRTDFDLKNHFKEPPYQEEGSEPFYPHVIEPTWGVDRTVLAVLLSSYREEENEQGKRMYLTFKPHLAPYKIAVFPLIANKPQLVEAAEKIYDDLRNHFMVAWDDRGNIGKRYFSQDEIGTPWCVTIDYQTLEDGTVTVRDRDTMKQERIAVADLQKYFEEKLQ